MRVLVTGGTGFIGSNIVRHLLDEGHDVVATGHDAEQRLPLEPGAILQPSFLGLDWDALGRVDLLFHEAAINDTTNLNARELTRANVDGALELFRRVVVNGCTRIVYASSTAVYGNGPVPYREEQPLAPLNPYAESKKRLEEAAARFAAEHRGVTIVGLRYSNVYGPGERHKGRRASMIFQLAQQMRNGDPTLFKHGEQKRDYIAVADVVRANMRAADATESGIVNCGSGTATTFNRLVEILNGALGTRRTPRYIDNPYADRYQRHTACDMARAARALNFVPQVDIEAGIRAYDESGALVRRLPQTTPLR